jgi:hypothetical protein
VRDASRELRAVSNRILAELDAVRRLEVESRQFRVGSHEFEVISAEIEARAKGIFAMAAEQRSLGQAVPPQNASLEELDEAGA